MVRRNRRSNGHRRGQLSALLVVVTTVLTMTGCTSESESPSVEPVPTSSESVSTSTEPASESVPGSNAPEVPPLDDATATLVADGLASNDPEMISEVLWRVDEATVNDIAVNAVPEGMRIDIDSEAFIVDDDRLGSATALLTGSDGDLWDVVFWFRWDAEASRWRVVGTTEPVKR